MICQVFLAKSGGIFIKLDLRAADNKGWRIREAIYKEGRDTMQKQTIEFAVKRDNGNITRIGRTSILQPKTSFKGGFVRFYRDKPKATGK